MNKKVMMVIVLFSLVLAIFGSQISLGMEDGNVPTITLRAVAEFGGRDGDANYTFNHPFGVEVDNKNNLYILDSENHRIMVYDADGKFIRQIGSIGSGKGELLGPEDFDLDEKGNIYVADTGNSRIQIFKNNGDFLREIKLGYPAKVLRIGPEGNLYVQSNLPEDKKLLNILAPDGHRLSSVVDIMPDKKSRAYVTIVLNRLRAGFDEQGNILLGMWAVPLFIKCEEDGTPIFKVQVVGPEIDRQRKFLYDSLEDRFAKRKKALESKKALEDYITDIEIACAGGRRPCSPVYISEVCAYDGEYYLLVNGAIYVYNDKGEMLRRILLQDKQGNAAWSHHRMGFSQDGSLYTLDYYHTFKCFKYKIKVAE